MVRQIATVNGGRAELVAIGDTVFSDVMLLSTNVMGAHDRLRQAERRLLSVAENNHGDADARSLADLARIRAQAEEYTIRG